jgi:hypothetical protein
MTILNGINEVLNSLQINVKTPKGHTNSFGRYKYRTAEDILAAVKEELRDEKYPKDCTLVTNVQLIEISGRLFVQVKAVLRVGTHEISAEGIAEHAANKKGMDEAQLTGATITYARKYALQNLFGIDEKEDDIDSRNDEKEDKQTKKNAFGLSPNGALANGDDMKETLNKKNEEDFNGLKALIENCGGEEELKQVWVAKENVKIISSLKKWRPELYELLVSVKDAMKESFEQSTKE